MKADLPSSHDIKAYLHQQFVAHLKELKESIAVSDLGHSESKLNG
jgi:hypothetical protein